MTHKPLESRLRESIDIRSQLNKQGCMDRKENKDIFAKNARAFIHDNESVSFDIKWGSCIYTVCFRTQEHKQSGVHVHVLD